MSGVDRHHELLESILLFEPESYGKIGGKDQGFLDSDGGWVSREEAGVIALASGQVTSLAYPPYLFTEDLWPTYEDMMRARKEESEHGR